METFSLIATILFDSNVKFNFNSLNVEFNWSIDIWYIDLSVVYHIFICELFKLAFSAQCN